MFRLMLAILALLPAASLAAPPAVPDKVLFDFEDADDTGGWLALAFREECTDGFPNFERVAEKATSGKHSLKITFAGGHDWPTIITGEIPGDWMPWETFKADVTVSRECVVGFTVMQEKSTRDNGWDGAVSRWTKTAFLKPGTHTVTGVLHPNAWSAIRPKLENKKELGKCVTLEFFVYAPQKGDVVYLDNIRLVAAKEVEPKSKTEFKVLGVTPNRPLVLLRRMDYVYGDYEIELVVNGKSAGMVSCAGVDRVHRWRNWPAMIPAELVTETTLTIKQVAATAGRDVNMFHLWFFQPK